MLIGDSYAQDMVNVVYETKLNDYIQLGVFHISAVCGNLNVSENLEPLLEPKWVEYCKKLGWYRNETLKNLMAQADEIWLVSSWRDWQAPKVSESVRNIRNEYGKRVLVFGTKAFGEINRRQALSLTMEERLAVRNPIPQQPININNVLRAGLEEGVFVDTMDALCGKSESCPIFDKDGRLITYDGGHLTQAGARLFGERLDLNPLVNAYRNRNFVVRNRDP